VTYLDDTGRERMPAGRADLTDREVAKLLPFLEQVEQRPGRKRSRVEL
jgi:hypothetical protein